MNQDVEKVQKIAALVFIISVTILAGMILWFASFEKPPLVYRNLPFPVVNQVIHPGDEVPFRVDRCNKSSQKTLYTITRYIRPENGGPSLILGSTETILPPGCASSISVINILPFDLKPGKYRIEGAAEVKGTVKPLVVRWSTQTFEVTEAPKK